MNDKLKVLDLFSGIGGFSLGLERTGGFETVAFCEIDEYCRKVLAKHWPDVPCFQDVRKLTRKDIDGPIDLICGGYPCQPFSTAGKRQGEKDDRHLWPEVSRLLDEFRPSWFVGENVAGHISMGLDDVLSDLEAKGYSVQSFIIPACAVNAPHRRDRVWVLAYAECCGRREQLRTNPQGQSLPETKRKESSFRSGSSRETLPYAHSHGLQVGNEQEGCGPSRKGKKERTELSRGNATTRDQWKVEPNVGRVANGVPSRVDRLKSLGNAVVPQVVEMLGYAILEAENENLQ